MHLIPTVYVFTRGSSGGLGFSLQKCGADLPSATSHMESWGRAYEVQMTDSALDVFGIDTLAAISNLRSGGFHVSTAADFLLLPQHHRASS
jgi:hypothetical protein